MNETIKSRLGQTAFRGARFKRLKTITSYAGHARWWSEIADKPLGYLARCQCAHIPSPYAYSPSVQILDWKGRAVIQFEVSHRRYEVYEVPAGLVRFASDDLATDYQIRFGQLAESVPARLESR